ncbi:PilZ domain-containing protein [Pseudomonas prosekii]|uniref:PilZ domain-containing protein n=2 Tax=Pseudomonas prosekii TaxID=1148509 RepID=A0A1H1ZUC0_9PSED|nr:PilZ domain-containing protein [Pseudomonas prosekii]
MKARSEALVRLCLRALRSEFSMFTERRIERHQLPYFLRVFNSVTDKPIGFLGNVSADGLMLISQLPMMIGADFDLRLKIPASDGCMQVIDLRASCLWCHEDATPHHYDAGFSLQQAPPEYAQLVSALQQYFSFQPLPASA